MFHVKNMSVEDLSFAVDIANQMNWDMAESDFEFMMKLEPEGCFVLFDDSERIGIATTVSFGKIGWFGNLVVSENHRKKGAGSLLVKRSIDYLASKSLETIGLYAYLDKIPFYTRLGFKYDSEFIVLKGKAFSSTVSAELIEPARENLQRIVDYDESCFGASRKKSLKPILLDPDNMGFVSIENGRMLGYALAKVYDGTAELGPLVCQQGRVDIAINLLRTIIDRLRRRNVSLCVSKKEVPILTVLMKAGFSESFRLARMFLGSPLVKDCVYAAESLERG
jgi:GNAT superfamily N-acetyltransferase